MKKILLTAALSAAVALGASAKTADELRIYINPGHGSWTPDDRPCTLVGHGAYSRTNTDTLSFFETNTNLQKGFALMERLISYGLKFDRTLNQTGVPGNVGAARDLSNNIVMSRVKNGPYHDDNGTKNQLGDKAPADIYVYNRTLSEVSAEVEANNFDMFISIHSNAASEGSTANYPLFLYRGYDTPTARDGVTLEHQQTSREWAAKCWPYAFDNAHMNWSYYSATNMNLRGDCNFYPASGQSMSSLGYYGYLGVLKHGTPGFLVEGYFHTYQPARHRAMNWDADKVEGTAYAHGIADIFGLSKEKTGVIYGIARDKDTKFKDPAYNPDPTSDDAYLPLNGLNVTLKKGNDVVATYTTDNYYNGVFYFEVEPGTYTLEFEGEEYKDCEPVEVTVKAATVAYPSVKLRNVNWEPPTIVYENYPDPVTNPGILAGDDYNFSQTYVDEPVEALEGKAVRRVIARDGKLYILAERLEGDKPAPTIIVYDAANKAVLAQVSTEGTTGTVRAIGDIQLTADGVLVACNENLNHFDNGQVAEGETRGQVIVWRWENDENGLPKGEPVKWFSSMLSGNFYRAVAGHSMAYSGTTADGKIIMSAVNASNVANHSIFYNTFSIVDGQMVNAGIINKNNNTVETLGDFSYSTAPDDEDAFIISSTNVPAYKVGFFDVQNVKPVAGVEGLVPAPSAGFYRYAGHSFMVSHGNGQVALTDLRGYDNASAVAVDGTALAAVENLVTATAGEPEVDIDAATEAVTAAYMNLYAVRDGKVSKFTTRGAKQASHKVEYAYGLNGALTSDNQSYNVSFNLTGDVVDASLVVTPVNDADAEEVVLPLGALKAGANSAVISLQEFSPSTEYKWAVRTTSATIAQSGEVSADNNGNLSVRGGVITITDPEYDSFGYTTVAHGKAKGFDVYNPAGKKVADRVHKDHSLFGGNNGGGNQSNPFRGHEFHGKVLLAAWGDAAWGLTVFDPVNTDKQPESLYAGEKQSSGACFYDGTNIGGGVSGVCVVGKGEDTRIYTHSEDHDRNLVGPADILVRYDLGTAELITKAPVMLKNGSLNDGFKGKLANGQGTMQAYGNGFFVSQARGAGNNVTGVPSFMYIDAATEEATYNSGVLNNPETEKAPLTGNNCGLSITHDGKTLAVGNADGKTVYVYDVTWNGTTPTLEYRYAIPGGSAWGHMRFDYAGNLHTYWRENGGYHVYALAQERPEVTVPAKSALTFKGVELGVSDIVVSDSIDSDAPVQYFNLNGVAMPEGGNLAPGVYVRVQGGKATKVIIR